MGSASTWPRSFRNSRLRVRYNASFTAICACLVLTACDPVFHRVERFETRPSGSLAESELTEMEQIAVAHGFTLVADGQVIDQASREQGRVILAQYGSAIRKDPDWGSCSLTVLLEPSGVVVLQTEAFPSSSEPDRLKELRRLAIKLLDYGYAARPEE